MAFHAESAGWMAEMRHVYTSEMIYVFSQLELFLPVHTKDTRHMWILIVLLRREMPSRV